MTPTTQTKPRPCLTASYPLINRTYKSWWAVYPDGKRAAVHFDKPVTGTEARKATGARHTAPIVTLASKGPAAGALNNSRSD